MLIQLLCLGVPLMLVVSAHEAQDLVSEQLSKLDVEARVREIVEHFKQDDPLGVPGLPIPDPLPVPDFKGRVSSVNLEFKDTEVFKLSEFKVQYVAVDITELKTSVSILIPELIVLGNYKMRSIFMKTNGNFSVVLSDVIAKGKTSMEVQPDGHLQVEEVHLDMTFRDIKMKFDNLGFFGSLFQGIINTVGPFIFNSIKPTLIGEINMIAKQEMNAQLKHVPLKFSDDVPPVDDVIKKMTETFEEKKLDPMPIPQLHFGRDSLQISFYNGELRGLSSLHRMGDFNIEFRDNIASAYVHLSTKDLEGTVDYNATLLIWPWTGKLELEVKHVDVAVNVSRPANLDLPMKVNSIDIVVGDVVLTPEGSNLIDRILENTVNLISYSFKSMIVCVAEEPIREMLEAQMAGLDVEDLIFQNLKNTKL